MNTIIRYALGVSLLVCFSQCGMKEKMEEAGQLANKQFGDQYFKNAISLIELHKPVSVITLKR